MKVLLSFVLINLCSIGLVFAQTTKNISGTISSKGEPLIGVSIFEIGTSNGTATDFDGNFALKVKENATLRISYLGFEDMEIKIGTKDILNIEMKEKANVLEEVVAIGYGVQKKKLITGATVQVKGDDISKMNTVSALSALQSQTPGVNITKMSGKPGEGFRVLVRGIGTVSSGSGPLYIIDGVPAGNESSAISDLNPADIESVDVLKDGASAAIYGARGGNGVIIITTKQGKKGRASIQYDGYFGWQNVYKSLTPLNASQYMEILNESKGSSNNYLASMSDYDREAYNSGKWNGTNWLNEITRDNAPITNHTINITGGGDMSTYSVGFGYTSQSPIVGVKNEEMSPNYERYNFRVNSEHNLIKVKDFTLLQFGQTLSMVYKNNDAMNIATGHLDWNDMRNALTANPLYQVKRENGSFNNPGWNASGENNPIAQMYYNSFTNGKNYSARANFYAVLQPIKNLKLRSSFGFNYSGWESRQFRPIDNLNLNGNKEKRNSQGSGNGIGWTFDNVLSYDFKIQKDHSFSAMAGMSLEKYGLGTNLQATSSHSQFDDFKHAYINNGQYSNVDYISYISMSGGPWEEGANASVFGRLSYDYKGTYMGTVTVRHDGSSRFAKGYRWGTFPSVSAGWVITNESFMKDTESWLDFFKLRASWGQNGNNTIPVFMYLANVNLNGGSGRYTFGENKSAPTIGAYQENLENHKLKWETSEQFDIGFDSWFLHNRLGLNFDYYIKTTKDWLVQPPALGSWGTKAPWVNGGNVRNSGVEVMLTWQDKINDFKYSVTGNLAYNKNKVTKIANEEGIIRGATGVLSHGTDEFYRAEEGYPVGYFYGYKANGIIQTVEEAEEYDATHKIYDASGDQMKSQPGDVKYIDVHKDGIINSKDRTMIGNPHPDFTYGITVNMEWKGIDFSITGTGVAGNQIAQSYRSFMNMPNQNYTTEILKRWTGEGTSNKLPRLGEGSLNRNFSRISDQLYIEDGDYFRISNLTIGYDLNQLFKKWSPMAQVRIYGAVQNLVTFTKYSGMDPEIGYGNSEPWVKGIDLGTFPSARTFLVGITIKY
ncbi:TonB-dependent receptor [Dysgonomonas sp. 520]|uniref:SusC/RagA family TonB-linked outer membrane protein n=1 Tax=Dysgonomonas sp. 520 TaxID=2302931 RepID=UPI0013D85615|nr:TonB-dependent receptor [Dysgonomonas sp. 520]NDW10185.1 TonB-dependent receptor [Dysgonomonas sp. 520]